jgi:hypothetical protein
MSRKRERPVTSTLLKPYKKHFDKTPVMPMIMADLMRSERLGRWGAGAGVAMARRRMKKPNIQELPGEISHGLMPSSLAVAVNKRVQSWAHRHGLKQESEKGLGNLEQGLSTDSLQVPHACNCWEWQFPQA